MNNFTKGTTYFLDNYTRGMSRELAVAVIEQFGGEDTFISEHQNVCEMGIDCGVTGWTYTADSAGFYADHKKDIFDFIKDKAKNEGFSSIADMVSDFGSLRNAYDADEVATSMHVESNEHHEEVTASMAMFVAECLSGNYEDFLEDNPDEVNGDTD